MSWKRIFKLARKVKAPIIIANEDGNKAQVILPFDAYEDLLNENEFNWHGISDLDDDWQNDEVFELDDELSEVSEVAFDEDDEMNEAELYHQYRKKRDKDFGYIPYEELESLEAETGKNSGPKTAQPDDTAESAFEPMVDDAEDTIAIKTIDEPWQTSESIKDANENSTDDTKKSLSKSSEEMAIEDRFYFEPLEDEARDR
jgi:hypothetical protein